jgi:hypothetical protein
MEFPSNSIMPSSMRKDLKTTFKSYFCSKILVCLTSRDGGLVWNSFGYLILSITQLLTSISSIKGVVGLEKYVR